MLTPKQKRHLGFGAVILVTFVLVVFGCLASSANYNYCVGRKGEHETGQYDQKGSPIIERPIDRPSAVSLFVYCGGIYANENGSGITAFSTLALFITTVGLWYFTWRAADAAKTSADAAKKSIDLARDEFDATYRPEIVVHTIQHAHIVGRDNARYIGANITYFNKGTVPANSVVITGKITVIGGTPEPGLQFLEMVSSKDSVAPGGPYHVGINSQVAEDTNPNSRPSLPSVYCIGTISYEDSSGHRRQTGFCWKWRSFIWERTNDPNYEYSY
jgi:hypothetical protein